MGFAGCTVSNCQVAVHVSEGVEVIMRNNDLSFNDVAMCFMGYGVIEENIVWGNLHRSSLGTSDTVLSNSELVGPPHLGPNCLWSLETRHPVDVVLLAMLLLAWSGKGGLQKERDCVTAILPVQCYAQLSACRGGH